MIQRSVLARLWLALTLAALFSLPLTSLASAQTGQPQQPAAQIVRVDPVAQGISGNVTFTGIAADCMSGQPATRVAVYDGPDANAPYVADAAMDTVRNVMNLCPGLATNQKFGFHLIWDSHNLSNGPHNLTFIATFPGGGTATSTPSTSGTTNASGTTNTSGTSSTTAPMAMTTVPVFVDNFGYGGPYYGAGFGPGYGYPGAYGGGYGGSGYDPYGYGPGFGYGGYGGGYGGYNPGYYGGGYGGYNPGYYGGGYGGYNPSYYGGGYGGYNGGYGYYGYGRGLCIGGYWYGVRADRPQVGCYPFGTTAYTLTPNSYYPSLGIGGGQYTGYVACQMCVYPTTYTPATR